MVQHIDTSLFAGTISMDGLATFLQAPCANRRLAVDLTKGYTNAT